MKLPKGSVVVVTGASRGIGRATVLLFAQAGYKVASLARSKSALDELASGVSGGPILSVTCDVSDPAQVSQAFAQIRAKWGSVQALVNNAGHLQLKGIAETTDSELKKTIDTNLMSVLYCSREVFSDWSKPGATVGTIVSLGSLAGVSGTQKFPGTAAYAAAKAGVAAMTEVLAEEARPLGGRVVCIAPGAVNTEMLRKAAPELKAGAEPEDLAQMILDVMMSTGPLAFSGAVIPVYSNAQ